MMKIMFFSIVLLGAVSCTTPADEFIEDTSNSAEFAVFEGNGDKTEGGNAGGGSGKE